MKSKQSERKMGGVKHIRSVFCFLSNNFHTHTEHWLEEEAAELEKKNVNEMKFYGHFMFMV